MDFWGFPVAPNNLIVPGKRPMSSMSPSIVLTEKGDVALVTGASGGSRIISTIVQVNDDLDLHVSGIRNPWGRGGFVYPDQVSQLSISGVGGFTFDI